MGGTLIPEGPKGNGAGESKQGGGHFGKGLLRVLFPGRRERVQEKVGDTQG